MPRDYLLDSAILDPAKLTVTASHHKILQQDPGQKFHPSGIFAGKRKQTGSAPPCLTLEHAHGVTQILSPYSHSRIAKVPPVQTRRLQIHLSEQQTLGKAAGQLQASLLQRDGGKKLLCREAGTRFQGEVMSGEVVYSLRVVLYGSACFSSVATDGGPVVASSLLEVN